MSESIAVKRLALGSAQFGGKYGVANRVGPPTYKEIKKIIATAKNAGIDTLDTAVSYGESERVLGDIGVKDWNVVSKVRLPIDGEFDRGVDDIADQLRKSLSNLNTKCLYGLLIHNSEVLTSKKQDRIYQVLQELKGLGLCRKIGISIYNPYLLDTILDKFEFDLIQAPYNIFDRRLVDSGWITELVNRNIEIHVRSLFLQGLLLMPIENLPSYFLPWTEKFRIFNMWLSETMQTPLEACIRFALSRPEIDKFVIGVETQFQLKQIISECTLSSVNPPDQLSNIDVDLIDPSRWRINS